MNEGFEGRYAKENDRREDEAIRYLRMGWGWNIAKQSKEKRIGRPRSQRKLHIVTLQLC